MIPKKKPYMTSATQSPSLLPSIPFFLLFFHPFLSPSLPLSTIYSKNIKLDVQSK